MREMRLAVGLIVAGVTMLALHVSQAGTQTSWDEGPPLREVWTFENQELEASNPSGLALASEAGGFYVLDVGPTGRTTLILATPYGRPLHSVSVPAGLLNPLQVTYDSRTERLLTFDSATRDLLAIDPQVREAAVRRFPAAHLGLRDPRGMALDADSGQLFLLDAARRQIVRVDSPGQETAEGWQGPVSRISLPPVDATDLQSLALHPRTGHFFLLSPAEQKIYEVSRMGSPVASYDLAPIGLASPQTLVVAPSSDATDDPAIHNFYVVDATESAGASPAGESGGRIVELSTTPPVAPLPGVPTDTATLVTTTHTYAYTPPSPDPSGLAYLPYSHSLLISDGEVNEIDALFTGDNLFETTLAGSLLRTLSTVSFSDEPTGVAYNPDNNHLFFSDDTGGRGFYELDPGPDGVYDTPDDVVTFVDMEEFGASDPEGIAFDSLEGHVFVADGGDGSSNEVYKINPGANGTFDGVPPMGDDVVTQFDTIALGLDDPEGIEFNPDNGHLYILSGKDPLIAETEADGTLLRYIDLSAIDSKNLAGLAYAPASADPTTRHLYVVSRGVDNNSDPDENDGELYEVAFPLNIDNLPPFVDAGSNQTVEYPQTVTLAGTAADDGQPDPPGTLTTTWSQVSGPGTATFADPETLTTTVSFSAPGRYVLRLMASDGELSAYDEVTIRAKPPGLLYLPLIRAEISPSGPLNDGPDKLPVHPVVHEAHRQPANIVRDVH